MKWNRAVVGLSMAAIAGVLVALVLRSCDSEGQVAPETPPAVNEIGRGAGSDLGLGNDEQGHRTEPGQPRETEQGDRTELKPRAGSIDPALLAMLAAAFEQTAADDTARLKDIVIPIGADPVAELEARYKEADRLATAAKSRRCAQLARDGRVVLMPLGGTSVPDKPGHSWRLHASVYEPGSSEPKQAVVYVPIQGEFGDLWRYRREVGRELKLAICKKFNSQPLETRKARFEAAANAEKQIREAQKIGD